MCVEKGLEPLPLDDETNEQPFALLYKVDSGHKRIFELKSGSKNFSESFTTLYSTPVLHLAQNLA